MSEENKDANQSTKKPLNTKLILLIAFSVFNLGLSGTGLFFVYKSTLGWQSPSITEEQLADDKTKDDLKEKLEPGELVYKMDKFTVNLTGEPRRMAQFEINLEMLGKNSFEEVMDVQTKAKARDRILKIMSEQNFSDIESLQGKLYLKDKMTTELNQVLGKGIVKGVYFSEFVVQ